MSTGGAAPGGPGVDPRWTSSAKSAVGTALGARSMVWFTLSHGIVTEVYYPRVDQANIRDMQLVVTAEPDFFAEEKRDTQTAIDRLEEGVPAFRVTNRCRRGRFRIEKTIVTDPERNVLLQSIDFTPLQGKVADYRLYVLVAPHLANHGRDNSGWVGAYKGTPMLFAQHGSTSLAVACSAPLGDRSCGFVGVNDGWQQLSRSGRVTECYGSARHGNIALCAELRMPDDGKGIVLALGFGRDTDEAGHSARASLLAPFESIGAAYVGGWAHFHARSRGRAWVQRGADEVKASLAVLQTHEDKVRRGAFIASLSIPWGDDRDDHDSGGYHVVWPRDLVEVAGAMLAGGHAESARHALHYLMTTQDADGRWPQNMWLDGCAYWPGNELDETAFPILLANHLRRERALGELDPWPMVRRAAAYLARNGPVTPEDRWEEDGGYSTFTIAVEIAGLLAAAGFADRAKEPLVATYLRETADIWNDSLERWTYVTGTELASQVGVAGYYVRIAPPDLSDGDATVPLRNNAGGAAEVPYSEMVSPDALALVRFGLRAPDDARVLETIRVIDRLLCTQLPTGPVWHRYNGDGYGEHADGSAFDGTGIGRGWPLLTGERGHYELAAGRTREARALFDVMRQQSGLGGLIPEQIWDSADIPERSLFAGCPSGSAMPLAWAHAEYVKLARSLHDGRVFDMPRETVKRYIEGKPTCRMAAWRFNNKARTIGAGRALRVEARAPMRVHWSTDEWQTTYDTDGKDTTLGVWLVDLPIEELAPGSVVRFTFFWPEQQRWEGTDFAVRIGAAS